MTPHLSRFVLALLGIAAFVGCDGGGDGADPAADGEPADGTTSDGADDGDGADPTGCATEVPCQAEHSAELMLRDTRTGGQIVEEGDVAGEFASLVDARAGGTGGEAGYTYARFTDEGLERVDLSDQEALSSTDWDIAVRRFVMRLNSGVSGPSCVLGARTAPATVFDELDAIPDDLRFRSEQYFAGDGCEFVPDTSGIGAPQTVLGSFWSYTMCVVMTGNVYVVELPNGRHVKLQVQSYYAPAVQEECETTGMVSDSSTAGNVRVRWDFLD